MTDHPQANELTRWVEVDKIPPRGMQLLITSTPEECAAVAQRLGLLSLGALTATLEIERAADQPAYRVKGSLRADVVQECVVTLAPVPATVRESVAGFFMAPQLIPTEMGSAEIADVSDEVVEPIVNGAIDLGELVVQHLALGLEPYPRLEGAALPYTKTAQPVETVDSPRKPFAQLAALMQDKQNKKE